ncbi:MAG: hypothetical protein KC684_00115 [Candidatus Omnitrophica bacterium]|nr:hypothetical protein [Candidatus Omnitrophota bacterium]
MSETVLRICIVIGCVGTVWLILKAVKWIWKILFIAGLVTAVWFFYPAIEAFFKTLLS